jgi:hypothetical protein
MTSPQELLDRYSGGTQAFLEAVEGLEGDGFDVRVSPDEWSPREVIHHLADAELRSTVRLRQLLAEDSPTIEGYDEELYTTNLPKGRSVEISLDAIRAAREANLDLLRLLDDAAWHRTGTHTESGVYSVVTWLEIYSAHAHDHAEQVRAARTAGGR